MGKAVRTMSPLRAPQVLLSNFDLIREVADGVRTECEREKFTACVRRMDPGHQIRTSQQETHTIS